MKRVLSILLVALVLSLGAGCALGEGATITESEAIRIASEAVRATEGIDLTDEQWSAIRIYTYDEPLEGHSGNVWAVHFALPLDMSEQGLYSVTLEQHTGQILLSNIPANAYAEALRYNEGYRVMAEWNKEKGDMYYWSQQDTVDFFEKYQDGVYRMDGEGDLRRDDAIAVGKKYLIDTFGLTDEYLSGLPVSANLTKGNESEPSRWYIYFVDENIRSKNDGILAPHMVVVENPSGTILGGFMGDTNGNG